MTATKRRRASARRLPFTYKGERFAVVERPDLTIGGAVPWCIRVAGGWYRVATSAIDAADAGGRFIIERMRSSANPRVPSLLASSKFPLLLSIDGVTVAAWSGFVPRGKGAKTYVNPATGDRVATTRGPMWLFSNSARAPSECGSADSQQSIADVKDLATIWLRSILHD